MSRSRRIANYIREIQSLIFRNRRNRLITGSGSAFYSFRFEVGRGVSSPSGVFDYLWFRDPFNIVTGNRPSTEEREPIVRISSGSSGLPFISGLTVRRLGFSGGQFLPGEVVMPTGAWDTNANGDIGIQFVGDPFRLGASVEFGPQHAGISQFSSGVSFDKSGHLAPAPAGDNLVLNASELATDLVAGNPGNPPSLPDTDIQLTDLYHDIGSNFTEDNWLVQDNSGSSRIEDGRLVFESSNGVFRPSMDAAEGLLPNNSSYLVEAHLDSWTAGTITARPYVRFGQGGNIQTLAVFSDRSVVSQVIDVFGTLDFSSIGIGSFFGTDIKEFVVSRIRVFKMV